MEEAAAVFDGIQVISHLRGSQKVRAYRREDHVTDYFASPPGTPQQSFIRGRELITAIGGRVSLSVGAHRTEPFIISLKYAGEGPYRSMKASERR
jgi:hypothetical protein